MYINNPKTLREGGAKEQILAEVKEMQTGCILRELDGGVSKPGMCDSFDERVATVDRQKVENRLVEMRFEATV